MRKAIGSSLFGLVCCTGGQSTIAVGPNELGVAKLSIDRFERDGNDVFELRGLDAHDRELALVRLRTGTIGELSSYLPGDNVGSEITLSFEGQTTSIFSHETGVHQLRRLERTAWQAFVELDEVSKSLSDEAQILIAKRPPLEAAYQIAPSTYNCPVGYLLTTPVASQCCYSAYYTATLFVNPAGSYVNREGPSTPCRSQSGGSCSGAACYYGPAGFSRPQVWTGFSPPPYVGSLAYDYGMFVCDTGEAAFFPRPPTHEFPNVTGTLPTGQGCPGGATGAGAWDYY